MHWRRKWQPTPVFLPGESQGRGSLVGCRLWGRTESDMTEATQQQQQALIQIRQRNQKLREFSTTKPASQQTQGISLGEWEGGKATTRNKITSGKVISKEKHTVT